MKTKFLLLSLTIFLFSCQQEKNELEGSWILVDQKAKPNSKGMIILRGLLVDFKGNQLTYSYITSKKETGKQFWLEKDIIKIDTSTFGKIIHLSADSLIIEADTNSYDMHFRPLDEVSFSSSEKENIFQNLLQSSWSMKNELNEQVFYFDTTTYYSMPVESNNASCIVYESTEQNRNRMSDYEWWTLKRFKGKLVLGNSYEQIENSFFQITKYTDQKISGKYISVYRKNWKESELQKGKILSAKKLKDMKKMVIRDWEIQSIVEPSSLDSLEEYSNLIEEWSRTSPYLKKRISVKDLKEKTIKFFFKENGEFQIIATKGVIRNGKSWEITNDGRFIKLDGGVVGENFIKILNLDNNEMQMLKKEWVDVTGRSCHSYLNLVLTRKES